MARCLSEIQFFLRRLIGWPIARRVGWLCSLAFNARVCAVIFEADKHFRKKACKDNETFTARPAARV